MFQPIRPQDLCQLLSDFPDVAAAVASLDTRAADAREVGCSLLMGAPELVRAIAAIGRGVPVETVGRGAIGNWVAALGCLHATGNSAPHQLVEMLQILAMHAGAIVPDMGATN